MLIIQALTVNKASMFAVLTLEQTGSYSLFSVWNPAVGFGQADLLWSPPTQTPCERGQPFPLKSALQLKEVGREGPSVLN